jgi:hypothetical protein
LLFLVDGRALENKRRRTTFGSGSESNGLPTWRLKLRRNSSRAVRSAEPCSYGTAIGVLGGMPLERAGLISAGAPTSSRAGVGSMVRAAEA